MKLVTAKGRLTSPAFKAGFLEEKYDPVSQTTTQLYLQNGRWVVRAVQWVDGHLKGGNPLSFNGKAAEAKKHFNKVPGTLVTYDMEGSPAVDAPAPVVDKTSRIGRLEDRVTILELQYKNLETQFTE